MHYESVPFLYHVQFYGAASGITKIVNDSWSTYPCRVFFYVLHLCAEIMTRCVVYDSTCYSEHMLSFQEPKKIKSKYAIGWWHLLALIQFDKRCFSTKNGINVLSVGNATKKFCTPPTCQQCSYSQTQRSVLVSSTHLKLSLVFFAT